MPSPLSMEGVVGASADGCVLQLTNEAAKLETAEVTVVSNGLCRSHAAYATLLIDAEPVSARVDLNDTRMHLEAPVGPGQEATVVVRAVDLKNGTMCLHLGDTRFRLTLTAAE